LTLSECIDGIKMLLATLRAGKATGRHIIAIDMNQGGIGSFRMFGVVKAPKGGVMFIGNNGVEQLQEIK